MIKKTFFLNLLLISAVQMLNAQITGTWKTIDDENGQAKSYVDLYLANNVLYGKVSKLLQKPSDAICEKCPDERKNQPVLGMIIVVNMNQKDGFYQGGSILDPEKGKWYNCKMWLKDGDPNTLVVRGYYGPMYRTQYWYRVN
ncbi:MAG: DUF2147 domain-containing protein [Bacteroidetes bacterium]|nr:DUF2147 domain-containing protein [Bacteroidota bacterium]